MALRPACNGEGNIGTAQARRTHNAPPPRPRIYPSIFLRALHLGKALPYFLVLIFTGIGSYMFWEEPKEVTGTGVKAASVFRTSLIVLLWRLKIPRSLRKLGKYMQFIIEFITATYIVEYLQADFWVPLETAIKTLLEKFSQFAEEQLNSFGEYGQYAEYIRNEWTLCFVVYGVSLFFFISVLHAVRAIDLREMKYGPEPFLYAIVLAYRTYLGLMLRAAAMRQRNNRGSNRHTDQRRGSMGNNSNRSMGWREDNDDNNDNDNEDVDNNRIGGDRDQRAIEWPQESDLHYDDNSDYQMEYN